MTLGVEFEEDTFGRRPQMMTPINSTTTNKPLGMPPVTPAQMVGQIQIANLQNYQKFFIGQNDNKVNDFKNQKQPWIVRFILRTGIVKTQTQAEILIVVLIVIMLIIAVYFLVQTYSVGQISTIQINQ